MKKFLSFITPLAVLLVPMIGHAQILDQSSVDKIIKVETVSKDCVLQKDIEIKKQSQIKNDDKSEFVLGTIDVTLDCQGKKESKVYVKIYFDREYDPNLWVYRVNRNGAWNDMLKSRVEHSIGSALDAKGIAKRVSVISYEITDGDDFDSDATKDGIIKHTVGVSEYSKEYLQGNVTVKDTIKKSGYESITLTGLCEVNSKITIFNRLAIEGNQTLYCTTGTFKSTIYLPIGSINNETLKNISIIQKSPNGNNNFADKALPVSITIDAEQKQEKLSDFKFYRGLKMFDIGNDVRALQSMLNQVGFPVAQEGGGSLGQENTQLSNLTWKAVRRFQNEMGIGGEEKKANGKTFRRLKSILKSKGL